MPVTIRMDAGGPPSPEHGDGGPTREMPCIDDALTVTRAVGPTEIDEARTANECATCGTVFSGSARFCPFDGEPLRALPAWRPEGDPAVAIESDVVERFVQEAKVTASLSSHRRGQ